MNEMYPNKESMELLAHELKLQAPDEVVFDWQYLVIDADRVDEFINYYIDNKNLTENGYFTLFIIIWGSVNEAMELGFDVDPVLLRVNKILDKDFKLHKQTLQYWACLDNENLEDCFEISRISREYLTYYSC